MLLAESKFNKKMNWNDKPQNPDVKLKDPQLNTNDRVTTKLENKVGPNNPVFGIIGAHQ